MNSFASLAIAHLILRLQPLHRALRASVEKQKIAASRLAQPDLSSLCLTDQHVHVLLDQIDEAQDGSTLPGSAIRLTEDEQNIEAHLRDQCGDFAHALPLDRLECDLHLSPFEVEATLLCAAAELDRAYGRVFSFLLDDLNRRAPSLELLTTLTAASLEEVIERRHALSPFGRVRRGRILQAIGDSPTELGQEFRLAPGLFDFLTGLETDILGLCSDRFEVPIPAGAECPAQVPESEFIHLCAAIEQGTISVLGIWGPRQNGVEEMVAALCTALQKPLRRLSILELERAGADASAALFDQLRVASGVGGALWLDTDALRDPSRERIQQLLAETLGRSLTPVFITGEEPWRPLAILRSGAYSEFELGETDYASRERLWSQFFPELKAQEVNDLASRFSLAGSDIRSISDLARMRARLAGNGTPDPVQGHLAAACAVITRRSGGHFASIIQPRRGPSDLVLADKLHRQVVEVATFFQLRNQVDGAWGFGHLLTGGGMKALFTGEPGTGKTLAAEVIAGLLGLPLYKVDLARIVSKWVGETEKNLESAFREAEDSQAVLFFDEAEALFGKRGEVQHGTDRYANLEVSYLLQRLEASRGLVILASNLKDEIDPAFTRRFHVAVHFPRPEFEERLRIWRLAFPPAAPLDSEVNLEALAQLDMTGAAIVTSARTAALLAANAGVPTITMSHVIQSAARQFRREARVLTPVELGPYAVLLQGLS